MKFTLDWLKEHLDTKYNEKQISNKLTSIGLEVESFQSQSSELDNFMPEFTIINASDVVAEDFEKYGLNSSTFIMFNLERKIAIIGGTEYAGEMKKGIFSVLHYLLPMQDVLSMHCSCNVDETGQNSA